MLIEKFEDLLKSLSAQKPQSPFIQKDVLHSVQKKIYSLSGGKAWINLIDTTGIMIEFYPDQSFIRKSEKFVYPFNDSQLLKYLNRIRINKLKH